MASVFTFRMDKPIAVVNVAEVEWLQNHVVGIQWSQRHICTS